MRLDHLDFHKTDGEAVAVVGAMWLDISPGDATRYRLVAGPTADGDLFVAWPEMGKAWLVPREGETWGNARCLHGGKNTACRRYTAAVVTRIVQTHC